MVLIGTTGDIPEFLIVRVVLFPSIGGHFINVIWTSFRLLIQEP